MPAQLIDGTHIAGQIHAETRQRVAALRARGIQPGILFLRVGEDPASRAYVGMKDRTAADLGITTRTEVLPEGTSEAALLDLIARNNADPAVHGILVQAPLPPPLREQVVYAAVDPAKDVDGFHPVNVGRLLLGDDAGFRPCTPAGIQELLVRSGIPTQGCHAVILGRGNIVGKPLAALLCQKNPHANATVTLAHSLTRDLPALCRTADILIAAMGRAGFVRASMVKPGAVVIDVGVNRVADPAAKRGYRLVGDVAFEEVLQVGGRLTPNPGGVGPMTIAVLMANTVRAAENAAAR